MEDWKSAFYSRYSRLFRRDINVSTYAAYEPYGKYVIKKCFPKDKNAAILDMGCGLGGFVKVFLSAGYTNVRGIDVSAEDINHAHHYGIHQVEYGNLMETLENAAPKSCDVVLYLDVIEHFTRPEVLSILQSTFRVLRPGGTVIIHVPNAEGIFGSRIRYSDFTHELAFTEKSLGQIATYAGFGGFNAFEDRPLSHSLFGLIRAVLWPLMTFPFRILHMVETGTYRVHLSQNILFKATRP